MAKQDEPEEVEKKLSVNSVPPLTDRHFSDLYVTLVSEEIGSSDINDQK